MHHFLFQRVAQQVHSSYIIDNSDMLGHLWERVLKRENPLGTTLQNRAGKGRELGGHQQEALPGTAPRRGAAASGNPVGSAHSPKDMLMEVLFLPFYVNLNDVCLCPAEQKEH